MLRSGTPRIVTRPSASTRSASAHSKCSAAVRGILVRACFAAAWVALPATTAARLAKVPTPQLNWSVSPVTTSMSETATPISSAAIWAKLVKWP